jgi:hypothetical protein
MMFSANMQRSPNVKLTIVHRREFSIAASPMRRSYKDALLGPIIINIARI